jgi:serine/threonine protein kinase
VRVYDFGVDRDRRAFLVMELLEGETLRQRLTAGAPYALDEARPILSGLCRGLAAAHGHGLVHRDLKPENIFLQGHDSGVVPKVLDFGLAKALAPEWGTGSDRQSSGGAIIGTLDYMSPEQIVGDAVDPSWDLWALGIITYEMLTTRHPFRQAVGPGANDQGAAARRAGERLADGTLSRDAAAFFDLALSGVRAERPASAVEFFAAFERVLA